MNVVAGSLAVLLAFQGPAPAPAARGAICDVADNRCKAERFERQAAQASSPSQRALYLHAAYRSYMGLHKETAEVRDLCEARRAFDQSLAVEGLSADQRTSFEEGRAELEARERKAGTRCGRPARQQARAPRPRSTESSAPKSSPRPTPVVEPAMPTSVADEPVELLPVASTQRRSPPRPPATAVPQTDSSRASPTPAVSASPRHGRPLVIAGGATLALGLSLVGLAGYSGSRALAVHRAGVQLHEDVQGPPDDDARAKDAELEREYRRMGSIALGTGIAGGVAVIVGTALVAVGGRRLARMGSSTAFVPVPGGLAFHARF